MARALVTGATGFIGRHVVRRLLERGDQVRCLVRRQPQNGLASSGVEIVLGDVTRPESLRPVVRGVDLVFHVAGATQVHTSRTYARVNSEGTRHLAEACARLLTPPKLVYVSSLAAAGPSLPDSPRREGQSPAPVSAYGRSKLAAEGHLQKLASVVPITVVRPPVVYGPGDPHSFPIFSSVRKGFNVVPRLVDPNMSFIYVEDLVNALVLAGERGRTLSPGSNSSEAEGIYFASSDESLTFSGMGLAAAKALNVSTVRTIRLPMLLCWLGAYINQFRATLLRKPIIFTPDKIREALAGSWICSSDKAKAELGLKCTINLADGFKLTGEWYRRQGWL
jgi:nucleoside-diphosphate-sugar epimerase